MTFLALCFLLYFAPAVIASTRRHSASTAIWFANFFLGWTVLGWIACLICALTGPREIVLWPAVFYPMPGGALGRPPGWQMAPGPSGERVCAGCFRPRPGTAPFCSMCGASASLAA